LPDEAAAACEPPLSARLQDPILLRRQIRRGLQSVEETAAEAKRRNKEVTRSLASVQADIQRISDRMKAVKQQGGRAQTVDASGREGIRMEGPPHSARVPPRSAPAAAAAAAGGRSPLLGSARGASRSGRGRPLGEPSPRPPCTAPLASGKRRPGRPRPGSLLRGGGFAASTDGVTPPRSAPAPSASTAAAPPPPAPAAAAASDDGSSGREASPPLQLPTLPEASGSPLQLLEAAQRGVRAQLLAARGGREEEQRALVKRLMVKWHPDRHPDNVDLATSVFQYIQQEKDRLLSF